MQVRGIDDVCRLNKKLGCMLRHGAVPLQPYHVGLLSTPGKLLVIMLAQAKNQSVCNTCALLHEITT